MMNCFILIFLVSMLGAEINIIGDTCLDKINTMDKNEKLGYFDLINKTVALLTYQISKMTIEKYPPDILINISRKSCGIFDNNK